MIELENINKHFRVARRKSGFGQAIKALVSREYHDIHALNNVSFKIQEGEMVGYIGPNGAGKSTSIKIMCGILTPDSGNCTIDGLTPWKNRKEHAAHIGVVFGQRSQLWWDVPVGDSFDLIRDIYKVEQNQYRNTLDELVSILDLEDIIKTPARNLSLGQRMRCEIAASLLHQPKILFLDEPTIGLDAISKLAVRNFIRKQNKEHGTTVVLTTHDMQDIEALTERILLIGNGQILLDGRLNELRRLASSKRQITLEYQGPKPKLNGHIKILRETPGHLQLEIDTTIETISNTIAYLSNECTIQDLSVSGISSEELIANLYRTYKI